MCYMKGEGCTYNTGGGLISMVVLSYGGFLGPPVIQNRRCGNTSYSCHDTS